MECFVKGDFGWVLQMGKFCCNENSAKNSKNDRQGQKHRNDGESSKPLSESGMV